MLLQVNFRNLLLEQSQRIQLCKLVNADKVRAASEVSFENLTEVSDALVVVGFH